jgi:hypothetical protein
MRTNRIAALALTFAASLAAAAACVAQEPMQQQGAGAQPAAARVDRRKQTKVQTASAEHGGKKAAVEVRYLDLPWGEATFGYIETGLDPRNGGYYAGRSWPIAHLRLAVPATYDGKQLAPGDYAFVITPRDAKANRDMTLALASFKPEAEGGTFLKAGDVFVETPKDVRVIASKPVKFAKGGSVADQLQVAVGKQGRNVEIKFHYGDRTLTEKLKLR